jgi:excisionase family DNA binding protein
MKTQTETVVAGLAGDRLMGVREVAARLAVSTRTAWKLAYAGKLPAPVRLGRCVRWRASDLQGFIESRCSVEGGRR